MPQKYRAGSTAYILQSNRIVREVVIVKYSGGMYLIRFADGEGGIRVKEHRLFPTAEEAENGIAGKKRQKKKSAGPYDYEP